jgi:cytochrome c6
MMVVLLGLMMGITAPPSWADAGLDQEGATAIASGEQIFEIHCAGCHPNGGNIIRRGKSLTMRALRRNRMDSVEAIAHITTVGKRPMSAYQDTLTDDEIQAVSEFVLDQAQHDWK